MLCCWQLYFPLTCLHHLFCLYSNFCRPIQFQVSIGLEHSTIFGNAETTTRDRSWRWRWKWREYTQQSKWKFDPEESKEVTSFWGLEKENQQYSPNCRVHEFGCRSSTVCNESLGVHVLVDWQKEISQHNLTFLGDPIQVASRLWVACLPWVDFLKERSINLFVCSEWILDPLSKNVFQGVFAHTGMWRTVPRVWAWGHNTGTIATYGRNLEVAVGIVHVDSLDKWVSQTILPWWRGQPSTRWQWWIEICWLSNWVHGHQFESH